MDVTIQNNTVGTPINITNNTISGQATATQHLGSNAIRASMNSQVGVMNVNISCNGSTTGGCTATGPITNIQGQGISVFAGGTITGTATIDKNVIVANQTLGAGTQGLAVQVDDGPAGLGTSAADYNVIITNNNVSNYEGNGIRAIARASLGKMDVTIQNNTVGTPILGNRNGIRVDGGSAVGDTNVCLSISGNTSDGSGVNAGIGIRKQGTVATTNDFGIVGLSPSPTTAANAAARITADNPAGGGVDVLSGDNFVSCGVTPFAPTPASESTGAAQPGNANTAAPGNEEDARLAEELFEQLVGSDARWLSYFSAPNQLRERAASPMTPADYLKFSDKPVFTMPAATATTEPRPQAEVSVAGGGASQRTINQLARPIFAAFAASMSYINPLKLIEASVAAAETPTYKPAAEAKASQPAQLYAPQGAPPARGSTQERKTAPQRQKPPTRILVTASGETVMVGPFNLPPGESAEIMFQVTVNDPYTGATNQVCNTGHVSYTGNPTGIDTNQACTTANLPDVSVAVSPSSTPEDGAGTLVYTFTRDAAKPYDLTVNFNVTGSTASGAGV
jgi:hypothetical protein